MADVTALKGLWTFNGQLPSVTEVIRSADAGKGLLSINGVVMQVGSIVTLPDTTSLEAYTPRPPVSAEPAEIMWWTYEELNRLSILMEQLVKGNTEETNVAESKPRNGMIRLADGTNWDPGSGQGVYAYYNNQWNKLG